jgi:hypothetical protein
MDARMGCIAPAYTIHRRIVEVRSIRGSGFAHRSPDSLVAGATLPPEGVLALRLTITLALAVSRRRAFSSS